MAAIEGTCTGGYHQGPVSVAPDESGQWTVSLFPQGIEQFRPLGLFLPGIGNNLAPQGVVGTAVQQRKPVRGYPKRGPGPLLQKSFFPIVKMQTGGIFVI
jgi:hypothetical protein